MLVAQTIDEFRAFRERLVGEKRRQVNREPIVGFVPTMGNLHLGHLSLIRRMRAECDLSVVSIYVNPTQFGPKEDFARYPRTPDEDLANCQQEGVDIVFMPTDEAMYPQGFQTRVSVNELSKRFEGEVRPGHFDGVALICCKLFNIVQPHKTYFGQKDYQQFRVVERMIEDLNMRIEMVMCPTVREKDGLAMSSRNQYLNDAERREAGTIYKCLVAIGDAFASGERVVSTLQEIGRKALSPIFRLQYLSIADPITLAERAQTCQCGDVVLIAGILGNTHLIDNVILGGGF